MADKSYRDGYRDGYKDGRKDASESQEETPKFPLSLLIRPELVEKLKVRTQSPR